MKKASIGSLVLFLGAGCLAVHGENFNVKSFGATGDGKTLDTAAIRKALNTCVEMGGGTVVIPAGTYLSQPLNLGDNTILQLDKGATLKATDDPADFYKQPGNASSFRAFIEGKGPTSLRITGQGTIDGSGARWWGPAEEARRKKPGYTLPRPNLIHLANCQSVVVEGVTIKDSPKFHLVPENCDYVLINRVTILAPEHAANTDAIDPSTSRNVTITNCYIDVGDDNVAIKSGNKVPGRDYACENITVSDCTFKHGHGMSIGSETRGGVRNVTIRNCNFENTENGIRIKTARGRGGPVENYVCENIRMTNVAGAITITCYYPKIPDTETNMPVTDQTPRYSNIFIKNLTATSTKNAGVIVGLPESHIKNVVLDNVRIDAAGKGLMIRNADNVQLNHVQVTAAKGPPLILRNAQVEGLSSHAGVLVTNVDDVVRVEINGQLFTEYHYKDAAKPYCYPIIGPTLAGMTRDWPMKTTPGEQHDHPHHRGFWVGHGDVNGVDVWTDKGPKTGRIVHDSFEQLKSAWDCGVIKTRNSWVDSEGNVLCTDGEKLTFYNPGDEPVRMFDFEITFHATNGTVVLGDTKEGTVALRIAESMRLVKPTPKGQAPIPGAGHIVNSEGQRDGDVWGKRADWVDYYGPVDGRIVGVAIFDHPSNLRHPTTWHARDYGLLAANPFGLHDFLGKREGAGKYKIRKGKSLTLKYRIFLHQGDEKQGRVADHYAEFLKSPASQCGQLVPWGESVLLNPPR